MCRPIGERWATSSPHPAIKQRGFTEQRCKGTLVLTSCSPDRSSGRGPRDFGCRALPHVYRRGEETGVGRSLESEIWGCLTVPLRVLFPVFGPSDLELPARGWGTNLCELTDAVL